MVDNLFDITLTTKWGTRKLLHIPLSNNLVQRITKVNLDNKDVFFCTQFHTAHLSQTP